MTEGYWARYESVVDRQIRMAQERGDFDDLPGKGKPLALDGPDDENWWVQQFVKREGISSEALLPTPLQLRKEVERLPETVRDLPTEESVRAAVSELNARIVAWLRAPSGPAVPVRPVDADAVVEQWATGQAQARASSPTTSSPEPQRIPWWRRLFSHQA